MSITSLLGPDGKIRATRFDKMQRAALRQAKATRQEMELLHNDDWNDAFRAFVQDRDDEQLTDDARSIACVL